MGTFNKSSSLQSFPTIKLASIQLMQCLKADSKGDYIARLVHLGTPPPRSSRGKYNPPNPCL